MIPTIRKAVALVVIVLAVPFPATAATKAVHTPGALLFTFDQEPVSNHTPAGLTAP